MARDATEALAARALRIQAFTGDLPHALGLRENVCVSCRRRCDGWQRGRWRPDQLTRGHVVPRRAVVESGLSRFWFPQCGQCNHSQADLAYYDWVRALARARDPRVRPAFDALKKMVELGLGIEDLRGPPSIWTDAGVAPPTVASLLSADAESGPPVAPDDGPVLDVVLVCGLLEELEDDQRPPPVVAIDREIVLRGGRPMARLDLNFSGAVVPGVLVFGESVVGVDPTRFRELVLRQEWQDPEQVCLVLRTSEGPVSASSPLSGRD